MTSSESASRAVTKVLSIARAQHEWRTVCLPLMCSENVMSPTARELLASDFHHRYANSHGDGIFNGNKYIEEVDRLSESLAKRLFGARYVELHSPSGSIACKAPVLALTKPDDLVLELEAKCGGFSNVQQLRATPSVIPGIRFQGLPYDFNELNIDGDAAARQIRREALRVVVLGATFFLFPHPVSQVSEAAKEVGATVVYDAAHVFGLVAGKRFQDPFGEGADVITGSTHKTLPGPQAGIALVKDDRSIAKKITNTVHQSLTGPGHPSIRAAHALLFAEMIKFGERYAEQIVKCSKALAEALHRRGFRVVGEKLGFTRSHMVVINVAKMGGSYAAAKVLDSANITGTPSGIPGVDEVLYGGKISGIRFGTEEAVRLGIGVSEMDEVAGFVARALIKGEEPAVVAKDIAEFRREYQSITSPLTKGRRLQIPISTLGAEIGRLYTRGRFRVSRLAQTTRRVLSRFRSGPRRKPICCSWS